ncbi:hypothetical protein P154DRAFT_538854 [Amniculicola lignicola CBS 123094]|uniref:Ecp2 effector protein domain-containing protein n=1 Tax=Amniculicola lignicola CBS 123094 TaxID=1392246 RepID=A0A6A5W0Z6_9PLEO|nr:hypothetical protein P154DRAFT_538854 [Amniculicola lignicola CBS 123094]
MWTYTITTITALALLTPSALAIPTNITLTPRYSTPVTKGSCKTLSLPLENEYNTGVSSFCSTYFSTPQIVTSSQFIVSTVILTAYDKQLLNWVYKVSVDCPGENCFENPQQVDYKACKDSLEDLLSEGQLGEEYCVVDGTEDVLFRGGKREGAKDRFRNKVVFESRRRKGD